eukprot:1123371-Amphidinium_carterae.1
MHGSSHRAVDVPSTPKVCSLWPYNGGNEVALCALHEETDEVASGKRAVELHSVGGDSVRTMPS